MNGHSPKVNAEIAFEDEDPGIGVLFALRHAMGIELEPGQCHDCAGMGVIPWIEATVDNGQATWQTCPTCRGGGQGGNA